MTTPREIETASREDLLLRVRNIETALRQAEKYETAGEITHAVNLLDWALNRYETLPPFLQKRV